MAEAAATRLGDEGEAAWQIDEGEVGHAWRVEAQVDRLRVEPLVGAALPVGVRLDLGADRRVGREALARSVSELGVLRTLGLQHHEHERPARDDAAPARQEGSTDDILEH